MRVRLFKKTKDNQSYFQFIADNDEVVLNSQGYTSKDVRNNGVRSVVSNAGNADRYDRQSVDGKYFFILKAGNNQEIARSEMYDDEAAMQAAIASCMAEIPGLGQSDKAAEPAPAAVVASTDAANPYAGAADGDDNYKPLAFYQAHSKGVENGFDTFASENGSNFYFTLNRGGNIVLISESYTSQSGRNNGVESVTKNLPIAERYQRKVHSNGKHYFNLLAGNNQQIATSVWFDSEGDMNAAIAAFRAGIGGVEAMEAGYQASVEIAAAPAAVETKDIGEPKKKKKRVKREPKQEKVMLKSGNYLFNDVTYETMQSGNGKYYFSFRNTEGKSVLLNANVRGFDTEEDVDAAVQRVMEFGSMEANYHGKTTKNGKFYFYLTDTDGNNIGKSFFFDTVEDMQLAIGLLVGRGLTVEAPPTVAASIDEYLPCEAYASNEEGFHKFFHAAGEEWYFGYTGHNGKTSLRSEGYTGEKARDNGVASVIKNAPLEERWKMVEEDGNFYYTLRAGNNQEIARSCPYSNAQMRDRGWAYLTGDNSPFGFGSIDRDGVRWSVAMVRQEEEAAAERQRREAEEASAAQAAEEAAKKKAEEEAAAAKAAEAAAKKKAEEEAAAAAEAAAKKKAEEEAAAAKATAAKLAAAAPKAERHEDDYLACKVYKSHINDVSEKYLGFITFKHEGEYYFAWVEDGEVLMRSEGYTTEKARDNGIASVKKNRDMEKRYSIEEKMNYFFVVLKAGNHQEIARSCPYKERAAAMALYPSEREKARAAKLVAAAPAPKAERHEDDYLACKVYKSYIDNVPEKYPGFITFEHEGEYYFAWVEDGEIILRSEGYTTEKARNNGIQSVMKNREEEKRFSIDEKMGYYFLVLKAGNHQEIGRGCPHKDKNWVMGWYPSGRSAKMAAAPVASRDVGIAAAAAAAGLAAASSVTPEEKEDDYLPCSAYEGHSCTDDNKNLAYFTHGGQSYFVIYNDDGSVRLRSEGFQSTANRDDELEAALKYLDNKEMYTTMEWGKYRLHILKDENGREVGRSCLERIPAAVVLPAEKEDDYLKCAEYKGHNVSDKENRVALFKHKNGQLYFAVYDDKGEVLIRSEGFGDAKERDIELSGVLKNIDNDDMYEDIRKGNYRIRVLKDKTGREVGRSCLIKDKKGAAVVAGGGAAAAAAIAAATTASATPPPPPPPPPPPKKVVTTPPPPPVIEKKGGFNWLWLLPILLLLGLLWWLMNNNGCAGCGGCAPAKVEQPAPKPEPVPDTIPAPEPEPEPEPAPVCDCNGFGNGLFSSISTANPKSLKKLGTYPEFGNSHSLDPAGFYNKLVQRHKENRTDRVFLDRLFKQMGYANGFADANAEMFSNAVLTPGTVGYMGYGRHQTVYASLDTRGDDLKAFRIEAANGCTMHFMKTCGNHFFFCSK